MANHLGPFPEASDGPEGREQPEWSVGGQGRLRGVTRLTSLLEICFLNPRFFGMGNHLGPFSEPSEGPVRAVGGQGQLRGVTSLLSMLETWGFFKPNILWYGKSFEIIFRSLRLT